MSDDATLDEFMNNRDESQQKNKREIRGEPVPADWDIVTIDEISEKMGDGGTPSRQGDSGYFGGDIIWVVVDDVEFEIENSREKLTQKGLDESSATLWSEGSVIVTTGASIGEVGIAKQPTATKQGITGITLKDNINSHFFARYLEANEATLNRFAQGTTFEEIRPYILRGVEMPLPPLEEQRKIATVLHTVDQAIQKTEEIVEQTHAVKKALMQDVFHGHHHDFDSYQSTPVGEIPSHWSVCSIGDVVHTAQYGISESMSEEGQYPIFRMNNIENGYMIDEPLKYIDLDDEDFEKYRIKEGDILFNRTNSLELVGKTGIYELKGNHVFASYLVRLQTNDKADPYYLNYYMNSPEAQNRMMAFATKGVSQANINANSIQQVKLPLPPIEEQEEITNRIRSIDSQIEVNQRYKSGMTRLKQGLTQDLLSGTVRTADINIEVPDEIKQYG